MEPEATDPSRAAASPAPPGPTDGQLVQQGDHQELVEEEGMYGQLFQAQFAQ